MKNTRTAFTDTTGDSLELITGFSNELILFKARKAHESNYILVELDEDATNHLVKLLTAHLTHLDSLPPPYKKTTKIRKLY